MKANIQCLIMSLLFIFIFNTGCTKGFIPTSTDQTDGKNQSSGAENPIPTPAPRGTPYPLPTPAPDTPTLWVYKSDQSQVDQVDSGVSLNTGAAELVLVPVYGMKKVRDENFHIENPNSNGTGLYNAYRIAVTDLTAAQSAGYEEFSFQTQYREEKDCEKLIDSRTMVALIIGQSNAANSVPTRSQAQGEVYNYFDGHCYKAKDPMLGTSGTNGSIWPLLGDKLIQGGKFNRVLYITIAVGGSEIASWAPNGVNAAKMSKVIEQLKQDHISVTHVLWHQGETDNALGTTADFYKYYFLSMFNDLRSRDIEAPIYVSVATYIQGGVSAIIQGAQRELINETLRIRSGPDTDTLGASFRYDTTHLNDEGAQQAAQLWYQGL